LVGGGILLGSLIGAIVAIVMKNLFNDSILQINASFISGFVAFFLAETVMADYGIHVSGIMTIISIGLFLSSYSKGNLTVETDQAVHNFW
jgi:NhaP-type Na+/H+ or K+/H+ antiporter